MNLTNRIARLEKLLDGGPCVACAQVRHTFVIRSDADRSELDRRKQLHRQHCTCGGKRGVLVIDLRRALATKNIAD